MRICGRLAGQCCLYSAVLFGAGGVLLPELGVGKVSSVRQSPAHTLTGVGVVHLIMAQGI